MAEPVAVYRLGNEVDVSVPPGLRADAAHVLRAGGVVLLPSDSAWSIAAIPFGIEVPVWLGALLDRPRSPFSLSFPSTEAARQWVAPDWRVDRLLDRFCPGPITVVCAAARHGLPWQLFDDTVGAADRTLGIRIADSPVERAVAGSTWYPVTTVPVLLGPGRAVADLDDARARVEPALEAADLPWLVVDAGIRHLGEFSTVVQLEQHRTLTRIREGPLLSMGDVEEALGV